MRRPVLLVALFLCAVLPASASAAQVSMDRACYFDNAGSTPQAQVAGSGFPAASTATVSVDGTPLGQTAADAAGAFGGSFTVPPLFGGLFEEQHTLGVLAGGVAAQAAFSVSTIRGEFTPSSGNVKTLKVRFSVHGMNLAAPKQTVYVHYIQPGGKLKTTIRLGIATGPCGHILKTKRMRLFPFTAKSGRWTLQFDPKKTYRRGTAQTPYPWATVGVRVRRIFFSR